MRVQAQDRQEDVERLVRARRQAPERAGEVPARGPPAVLVEPVRGDGRLEELDDVVDVRALAEQRQGMGVPLLGDGVRAAAVVEVRELLERAGILAEEQLAGLEERGIRGADDAQLGGRLARLGLGVEPQPEVHLELVLHVGQGLSERVRVAPLDGLAELGPDGRGHERRQRLGPPHRALRAPHGRGRDPLPDVLPLPPDPLEPGGHLQLEDGLHVVADEAVAHLRVALGHEARPLELEQDHLVDGQRDLRGHRAPGGVDERDDGRPRGGHVGLALPAPGDLVDHDRAHRVAEGLAHRAGGAHERIGLPEELVGGLEEAQGLGEVALPGRAPSEHVQGEAEGGEVPAPRAVADLGGARRVALQDLDGGAVLLEVLRGEVRQLARRPRR